MEKSKIVQKLSELLGIEGAEETQLEPLEVKLEVSTTLVDGTEIYISPAVEVGASVFVGKDEDAAQAPEGSHTLMSGEVIIVDSEGKITDIAAPEEMEVAKDEEKEDKSDEMLMALAEVLKPVLEEMKKLKEKYSLMETKLSDISNEPAAGKIKKNVETKLSDSTTDRMAMLRKIKNSK